jgi:hypothetical protein
MLKVSFNQVVYVKAPDGGASFKPLTIQRFGQPGKFRIPPTDLFFK